jgi:hypothetical protein
MAYTRREILIGLAGLGGSALVIPRIAAGELPAPEEGRPLGPEERETIAAAVERLIPGAGEAGVPAYMDRWLEERSFRLVRNYLAHGARRLHEASVKKHGRPFAACQGEEQDAILEAFAAGEFKEGRFDGGVFFQQLMEFTLEGYLSDPRRKPGSGGLAVDRHSGRPALLLVEPARRGHGPRPGGGPPGLKGRNGASPLPLGEQGLG